jgi:hypothetical protein
MHKPSNNRSLIWFCAAELMKKRIQKRNAAPGGAAFQQMTNLNCYLYLLICLGRDHLFNINKP